LRLFSSSSLHLEQRRKETWAHFYFFPFFSLNWQRGVAACRLKIETGWCHRSIFSSRSCVCRICWRGLTWQRYKPSKACRVYGFSIRNGSISLCNPYGMFFQI
jgi:hypothetical protein